MRGGAWAPPRSAREPSPQPLSRRRGETELSLQKLCGPIVSEVAGDIGGGLAAVVLEVERGAMLDERLDRGVAVVNARGRAIARSPHQRREAVGITAVDVDAGSKQQRDNRGIAMASGVDDRSRAVVVEGIGVRAKLHELSDAFRRPIEGRGGERANALTAGKVGI